MLLGPQCQKMMDNHCQCPNKVQEGTDFCELHNKIQAAQNSIHLVTQEKDAK